MSLSGFLSAEYDIVDYDILEGSSNEEVKDYFENRSPEVQAYMKQYLPDEYEKFQERIREPQEECDCAERSWYGKEHDSACPLAGQPNPNSLLKE